MDFEPQLVISLIADAVITKRNITNYNVKTAIFKIRFLKALYLYVSNCTY
jgi:hypothetical protein